MDFLWFEEMGLIVNPEMKNGSANTDQSKAEPKNSNPAVFMSIIAYDR